MCLAQDITVCLPMSINAGLKKNPLCSKTFYSCPYNWAYGGMKFKKGKKCFLANRDDRRISAF